MSTVQIANIIGFIAAGIGIIMFAPQAWAVWKTKNTKSLSLISFSLFGIASALWTIYGIIMIAPPIIAVNATLVVLNFFIVAMKLKYK